VCIINSCKQAVVKKEKEKAKVVVLWEDIRFQDGAAILKSTGKPFTGEMVYKNEAGDREVRYNFQEGQRMGEWSLKESVGNTSGKIIHCDRSLSVFLKRRTDCRNCSISLWQIEGGATYTSLFIETCETFPDTFLSHIDINYLQKYDSDYGEIICYKDGVFQKAKRFLH
jgi:uncharacterized protein YlzI (FlbEa/FlbD family)